MSPTLCRNAVFKRRIDEIGPMIVVRPMEDTLSLGSICENLNLSNSSLL